MMKTKKATGKFVSALSAVLAFAMLSTTVFAGGVLSGLTEDNYTVEITNNGEAIELVNKPFIENSEVYVPLRETFEKAGYDETNSYITWNNGIIDVAVSNNAGEAGVCRLEIGEEKIVFKRFEGETLYDANEETNAEIIFSGDKVPI